MFLCMRNTFFFFSLLPFLHYLIISFTYGSSGARARVWSFSSLHAFWHQSERDGQESKKKKHRTLRAYFFSARTIWCMYVCVYCTVIPFLLLLLLLSHNSCALSFFWGVYNLLDREKKKKKRKKKRQRARAKETKRKRDEHGVEQFCLHRWWW